MPIIKSAKKRVKTAAKANVRNAKTKRSLRDAVKAFSKAITSGKPEQIAKAQKEAVSAIDKAAKRNVIHKNKAARQKAQLSARAKAAGGKVAKGPAKKAAPVKKTSKPVTKKPAVKKPAAKKPAAKK